MKPEKRMKRLAALTLLLAVMTGLMLPVRAAGGETAAPEAPMQDAACPIRQFTDAKADAWYHDGVHWALETGLMKGVSDTAFAPGTAATRAMVVTMLWRLEGEPEAEAPAAFTDVTAGSWYEKAANWAAASGVVTGTSAATFAPNDPVTRQQLVTILYRCARYRNAEMRIDENILDFDDALTISPWAVEPFRWAVRAGVVTGMGDNRLSPRSDATRAQIAAIFQRFVEAVDSTAPAEQDTRCLLLVNKTHKLPDNWESGIRLLTMKNAYDEDIQVEEESCKAFQALREDLLKDGVDIELDSCYRSVARQEALWAEFEAAYGLDYTQKYVAVPGFSEHHTGFAVDVCLIKDGKLIYENDDMMKETAIWEKVHRKLADYGFILRYPADKTDITGYSYEPWHLRYVGDPAVAQEITDKGITLEEYLGQVEPADAVVDFGSSGLYTRDEMAAAIALIRARIAEWPGCELQIVRYAGDECSSADNVKWVNELREGKDYTQCIEFLTSFHTAAEGSGSLEPDTGYADYQWWLARAGGGGWELVSCGY